MNIEDKDGMEWCTRETDEVLVFNVEAAKKVPAHRVEIIPGARELDPDAGNADVVVTLDGDRFSATFFTVENIRKLVEDCPGGPDRAYVWSHRMIVVPRLATEQVLRTVADMIRRNELPLAFEGPVKF